MADDIVVLHRISGGGAQQITFSGRAADWLHFLRWLRDRGAFADDLYGVLEGEHHDEHAAGGLLHMTPRPTG